MEGVETPWLEAGADVSDAMVVVAAPTIGFVGPITAQFLVRQLDMDAVGGLIPPSLPPIARVGKGSPSLPVAIHARETTCGPQRRCQRLVVVETELMLEHATQHELAHTIVRWADEQDAQAIVAPDGFLVSDQEGASLRAAGSSPRALETLTEYDLDPMEAGYVVGLSGALLGHGEIAGLDTYCLLAESNPNYPDARAASRIVRVLDRFVPEIEIETEPLLEEAEKIEEHVRAEVERMRQQSQESPHEGGMMFG